MLGILKLLVYLSVYLSLVDYTLQCWVVLRRISRGCIATIAVNGK